MKGYKRSEGEEMKKFTVLHYLTFISDPTVMTFFLQKVDELKAGS
jgi:hypothetical protein